MMPDICILICEHTSVSHPVNYLLRCMCMSSVIGMLYTYLFWHLINICIHANDADEQFIATKKYHASVVGKCAENETGVFNTFKKELLRG